MVIEQGPQLQQESNRELFAKVAGAIHLYWFLTTLQDDGSIRERPKLIDPNWEEGPLSGVTTNIAVKELSKLPTYWQSENLKAAEVVVRLVRAFPSLDLRDPNQRSFAGSAVHMPWIERNDPGFQSSLCTSFDALSIDSQGKDLAHYAIARQLMRGTPLVVHGFPGIGKTHLARQYHRQVQDSDPSLYSNRLTDDRRIALDSNGDAIKDPRFPGNYGKHILDTLGFTEISLVSTHAPIRDLLAQCGLRRTVVFPGITCRNEYLGRYKARGDTDRQIAPIMDNWSSLIQGLKEERLPGVTYVELDKGEFLNDVEIVTAPLQHRPQELTGI